MCANRYDIGRDTKRMLSVFKWPQRRKLIRRSGVKGAVSFSEALCHALPLSLCALEFISGL